MTSYPNSNSAYNQSHLQQINIEIAIEEEERRRAKIIERTPRFRNNPASIQPIRTKDEFLLSGPYQCLAGETRIYNPITCESPTIEELTRAGKPITVLTMQGPQTIEAPFLKGKAPLYRVTMASGRSFLATARHRVLTSRGWACVETLSCLDVLLSSSQNLPASNSVLYRQGFRLNGQRSIRKDQGFQSHYSECFRRYDGQPLYGQDSDQVSAPLSVGVHVYSHVDCSLGGLDVSDKHTRLYQPFARPSSSYVAQAFYIFFAKVYYFLRCILLPYFDYFRLIWQYRQASHFQQPFFAKEYHDENSSRCLAYLQRPREYLDNSAHEALNNPWPLRSAPRLTPFYLDRKLPVFDLPLKACSLSFSPPFNLYYTAHTDTVSSVKYERTDYFYDMHVPGVEHYFAEGFWHHNTGKTFAALWFLDTVLREYPKCSAVILRKIRATMDATCLATWRKVIEIRGGVEVYGGEKPVWYDYPNGSRVFIAGLDSPGKVLSGEHDFIYVNQTEELDNEDWETLSTRTTGRSGHAIDDQGNPYAILFGDCNPGGPVHWILQRKNLRLLPTTHEDNPTLFNDHGEMTPLGIQTMTVLDGLTGAQYQRGRLGKWFASEGIILEDWRDEPGHPLSNVTEDAEYVPGAGPIILGGDDGYSGEIDERIDYFKPQSHPRVFILSQLRADGHLNVFYESFKIKTLHREHIAELLETCKQNGWPLPSYAVIDKSASTLKREIWENGIVFYNGANSVEESLKELLSWIKPDINNFIRLLVHPRCTKTRLEARLYARDKEGKIIKDFDHSWDILRYITNRLRFEKVAA